MENGDANQQSIHEIRIHPQRPDPHTWIEREVAGCGFKDARLAKRFGKLLGMLSEGIGESIPYACQDWANTKAALAQDGKDDQADSKSKSN